MLFLLSSFLLLYSFLNCQEEGSNQERMLLVILSMPNLLTEFVSMPINSISLLIPSLLLYYQPLHLCSTSFPLSPIKVHPLLSPSCIIYLTTYWIILISLKTSNSFQLKKKSLDSIFPFWYYLISMFLFFESISYSIFIPSLSPFLITYLTLTPISKAFLPALHWDQTHESHHWPTSW